jgi:hypothetical protein
MTNSMTTNKIGNNRHSCAYPCLSLMHIQCVYPPQTQSFVYLSLAKLGLVEPASLCCTVTFLVYLSIYLLVYHDLSWFREMHPHSNYLTYALSACSARSSPTSSSTPLTLRPIVLSITFIMAKVPANAKIIQTPTPMA